MGALDRTSMLSRTSMFARTKIFTRISMFIRGTLFGPELVTSFINGTTVPLDTLVTSGVDISSGIALSGPKGCVSNPFFPVATGEQYKLSIDEIIINSFTGAGLRILIVIGPDGSTTPLSLSVLVTASELNFSHVFDITGTDVSSYLQLGVGGGASVDFAATGISLKKVL